MFSVYRRMRLLLPSEKQNLLAVLRQENSRGSRPGPERAVWKECLLTGRICFPLKEIVPAREAGQSAACARL